MDSTIKRPPQFLGHPKGLFYLFFAELWERFSFYGMRALLVLYMTKKLLFTDDMSFGVFAAYMSLVYMTPIFGGVLADRYLGARKSIILGGVMMALGHFLLTIETPFFFFTSLALVIVGNGFFKPNISSFVGTLYEQNDTRKDSGFTIFYMGINIGGAIAPLLCAWLAEVYGWHYGFLLAGLGMIVGLIYFKKGIDKNVFLDKGLIPDVENYNKPLLGMNKGTLIWIGAFLSVPLFALLIKFNQYEHLVVWIITAVVLIIMGYIYSTLDSKGKSQLLVTGYFTILMSIFWAIFEQAGSSLTLFADRNINLIGVNAAQTNSINSGFIIFLAVPFSLLWKYLTKRNINPNSAIKSGLGLVLLGVGFIIFGASARSVDLSGMTPMWYLVLGYFILTVGELFISPIGLSKMTELSPAKYLAFIMGVFFTSSFYGHFFAGKIAKLTTISEGDDPIFSKGLFQIVAETISGLDYYTLIGDKTFEQLYAYVSVYSVFGSISVLIGAIAILISPLIKHMMKGVH